MLIHGQKLKSLGTEELGTDLSKKCRSSDQDFSDLHGYNPFDTDCLSGAQGVRHNTPMNRDWNSLACIPRLLEN